jgi:putative ABC transport system ATP-binding protein
MEDVIKLADVSKIYHMGDTKVEALKDIDIHIKKGEFVAIMGPSGSGKSTAMNLTGSLDTPTKGRIFLGKHNIADLHESDLAQIRGKRIGFIFQSFNLIPNLTALENVMLPMMFQGVDEYEREEKAAKLLKMVELGDRMEHYPNQLSGGQQQRVAIARSLANDPEMILADEPTGNLDSRTGEMVMGFLENLNKQGKTIVIVTHDANLAKEHARKIYSLKDGKIDKISTKKGNKWLIK